MVANTTSEKQKKKQRRANRMEYTDENIHKVAQKIVDDMPLDELMASVYDDLCSIMWKDDAHFLELLEMYGIEGEDLK